MKKRYFAAALLTLLASFTLASCDDFTLFGSSTTTITPSKTSIPGSVTSEDSSKNPDAFERVENTLTYNELSYSNSGSALQPPISYLPSVGDVNLLVLPIMLTDYTLSSSEQLTQQARLDRAFFGGDGEFSYYSVKSFYEQSSYGKLHLSGTVAPWYASSLSTRDLYMMDNPNKGTAYGPSYLIQEALNYYVSHNDVDITQYDQDKDGYIDAVWAIYSAPNYSNLRNPNDYYANTFWAFCWWNPNAEADVSNPGLNAFGWAGLDFLDEEATLEGYSTRTFIHETGHLLGLDDYYSYSQYPTMPLGGFDMMDYNVFDHNAFSKFALGWIEPYMAKEGTITLRPFVETGDALILPSSSGFNGSAFDEYLIVEYFTTDGLNAYDDQNGLWSYSIPPQVYHDGGLIMYHVNASLMQVNYTNRGYTYEEIDQVSSGQYTLNALQHCNTPEKCYANKMNGTYTCPHCLIEMVGATGTFDYSESRAIYTPQDMFQAGQNFNFNNYGNIFENRRLDDGGYIDLGFDVVSKTEDGITLNVSFN